MIFVIFGHRRLDTHLEESASHHLPRLEKERPNFLNIMKNKVDHFKILRKLQQRPESSQRELAKELGFSLGKLNYCLKALQTKGLVKIENFKKNPNKLNCL